MRPNRLKLSCHTPTEPKEGHIFHEKEYNTGHGVQAILNEIRGEIWRQPSQYNKNRSYIYFWRARWDRTMESLACQSRRPHSYPNQHTEAELKLIRDMRRRNPRLGLVELWHRLKKRGYTRRPESLFRVMRKLGMLPQEKKKAYTPKPCPIGLIILHILKKQNFSCRYYDGV